MTIEAMTPEMAKKVTFANITTSATYSLLPRQYAGAYRMENVYWSLTRKPSAWHRWWVRFTLGWVWEDAK